jgi:hypothetical protein
MYRLVDVRCRLVLARCVIRLFHLGIEGRQPLVRQNKLRIELLCKLVFDKSRFGLFLTQEMFGYYKMAEGGDLAT